MAELIPTGRTIGDDVVKNGVACDGKVDPDEEYTGEPIHIKPYPGSEDGGESASGSGE